MSFFTRQHVVVNIYGSTLSMTLLRGQHMLATQTFACQPYELDGGRVRCPLALIAKITEFLTAHHCRRINAFINAPFFATTSVHTINFYVLQLLLTASKTALIVKRIVATDVPTLISMAPQQQLEKINTSTNYLQPFLGGTKSAQSWLAMTIAITSAACLITGITTILHKPITPPLLPPPLVRKDTTKGQFKRDQQLLQLLSLHIPNSILIEQYRHTAPAPTNSRKKTANPTTTATVQIQGLALDSASVVTFCQKLQQSAPHYKFNLSTLNLLPDEQHVAQQNHLTERRYRFIIDIS